MDIVTEEHRKLFPVLEMTMTMEEVKLRLADEKASLVAILPREFVESFIATWQQLQEQADPDFGVFSRHYTSAWDKDNGS